MSLTIEEAYKKFATRFNVSKSNDYMALYLDTVPSKIELRDLIADTFLWFAYDGDTKPSPKTFCSQFWKMKHERDKDGEPVLKVEKGCSRCSHGMVDFKFARTNAKGQRIWIWGAGKCAACHTESHYDEFYLQMDDKIYLASRKIGKRVFVPDVNNLKLCYSLSPVNSNALLEESYNLGPVPCPEGLIGGIKNDKIRKVMEGIAARQKAAPSSAFEDDLPF